MPRTRLAVWGDPIAHSRSPQLHAAAYRTLGLDWEYTRRRVDGVAFGDALASLDGSWRGLSLTMPLKEQAHRAAVERDRHAELTGAVNTLLLTDEGPRGFNTDVGGIVDALDEAGIADADAVRILGAGATAASALVAVAELGARRVDLRARRPQRAEGLLALAVRLGLIASVQTFDAPVETVDLSIATLPSGTVLDGRAAERLSQNGGALFDVAYAPWPSSLAEQWPERSISGLGMLLHQAVRQIRIFHHGDQDARLPGEDAVVSAMRAVIEP
ncbi:shikimate dehydrogenase [Microbacterium sp. 1.5R]|uniref:shikimate dehydrogenase family protein n=1 Tax=Microbacterium sp. 1.5R TaxID=1916917 RepID=UPI0021B451C1|nr:shikimate dehydrogenase [Microbacterium sp. 1.5R]